MQKRRTADEILIFTGIPPIYTRGIRKPQMPLVTYQITIYSVHVFIQYDIQRKEVFYALSVHFV